MASPRMRMPWMHQHPWASPGEPFSSMQPYGGYGGFSTSFAAPFEDSWKRSSAFEWEREFEAKLAEVLDQNQELAMRLEASQQSHNNNDVDARLSEVLERNREMEAYLESVQQEQPHRAGEENGDPMNSPGEMGGLHEAESNLADALNHNEELMKQLHGMDHPFSTSDTFSMLERNRELIGQLQAMREHRPMSNNFRRNGFSAPHAAAGWGQMSPYDGFANPFTPHVAEITFDDGYRTGFEDGFQSAAAQVELSLPMAHQAWELPDSFHAGGFNGNAMGQGGWPSSREFQGGFNNNMQTSPRVFGQSSPLSHHGYDNDNGFIRGFVDSWNDRTYDEPNTYQRQGQRNDRFPQQHFNQQSPFDPFVVNQQPYMERPKARFEQSGSDPFFQEVSQRRKSRLKDHFY